MLKNWINLFIYHIKNNKLFTALNVLGLSIGIAGLIFAILYWNDEQSYNAWNPGKEKVFVSISQVGKNEFWASNVAPFEPYFKTDFKELEAYCYFDNWYYEEIIQYQNKKEIIKITDAQKTFFDFFPFNFIKGTAKDALKDNRSIAISSETAQKFFGTDDPMGKTLTYSGKKMIVRGVYTIPGKSSMAPMAVTSLINDKLIENKDNWGNFSYGLMLKLKNPEDKDKVITKMQALLYKNRVLKWAKEEGISPEEWLKKKWRRYYQNIFRFTSRCSFARHSRMFCRRKREFSILNDYGRIVNFNTTTFYCKLCEFSNCECN